MRLVRHPAHRPPAASRMVWATLAALGASLAVDALLVALGTRLFPSTRGYVHFRPSDYGRLTVIGVLVACAAWPVTTRISAAPRRLFVRMAVLVTLVLWVPDVWILVQGQPPRAVAVLMVMHLAIALCTYNLLVRVAPVRPPARAPGPARDAPAPGPSSPPAGAGLDPSPPIVRRAGMAMAVGLGVELVLGIGALAVVPYDRPTVWLPAREHLLYLAHATVGGVLGVGAVGLFLAGRHAPRIARLATIIGVVGVLVGAGGGLASVDRPTRLLGVGLMLAGTVVAGFGYLILVIEVTPHDTPP
jgi:hypothetical protein